MSESSISVASPRAKSVGDSRPPRFRIKRDHYGYIFVAPFVIGFLIFGLYPVYNTLALSFTDTVIMSRESEFVGLANFERLFADDFFLFPVVAEALL